MLRPIVFVHACNSCAIPYHASMVRSTESGEVMRDAPKENNDYQNYERLGVRINETDYSSVLQRARSAPAPEQALITQAELIAKTSGIALHGEAGALDKRVVLYGILRTDLKPPDVKDHYSQMSDQPLFAEALRMAGDDDSLQKLISTHPHISF